jgi:hypothetical protein
MSTAGGRHHHPNRQVELPGNHSMRKLEEFGLALKAPRTSGPSHKCMRVEKLDPVSGTPKLEEHDAPPVELKQVHSVCRIQCIEPHGNTPYRAGRTRPFSYKAWLRA